MKLRESSFYQHVYFFGCYCDTGVEVFFGKFYGLDIRSDEQVFKDCRMRIRPFVYIKEPENDCLSFPTVIRDL